MENKYFTPEISDFCIGYEYETIYLKSVWTKESLRIIDAGWFFESYENDATPTEFRVPYLTKEQIEAEEWELIQIYPKGACIFQKGTKEEGCELTCDFTEHRVHFTKLYFYGLDDEYTRTKLTWRSLECKDINTFRKIIKILEI